MQIVPQPSQGTFTLVYEAEEAGASTLRLRDVQGRLLWEKKMDVLSGENRVEVGVNKLPAGMYLLELRTESGVGVKKVLVE
jgi:hypothetical protein